MVIEDRLDTSRWDFRRKTSAAVDELTSTIVAMQTKRMEKERKRLEGMRLVYNEKDSLSVRHNLNITSHAAARDFPQCSAQCSITSNFLFSLYPLKSSVLLLIRLFRPSSSFVVCCAPPVQLQLSKNNCARLFLVEFKSRVRGESNVVIMKFLGNWVKCAYTQKHCSFAFSSMLRCLFLQHDDALLQFLVSLLLLWRVFFCFIKCIWLLFNLHDDVMCLMIYVWESRRRRPIFSIKLFHSKERKWNDTTCCRRRRWIPFHLWPSGAGQAKVSNVSVSLRLINHRKSPSFGARAQIPRS